MVVGKGSYVDRSEAYPLDKKTLNKIALRSFFVSSSFNGETGESIGWTWAMMPGLQKIHTNQEDLALSMGHSLEYVNTGAYCSTLAMGVVLALEQQKADLETIRSLRTTASAISNSISKILFAYILFPLMLAMTAFFSNDGNSVGLAVYTIVMALIIVWLRFFLMRLGYAKGTEVVDKLVRHNDALLRASKRAGIFMLGAMIVIIGSAVYPRFMYDSFNSTSYVVNSVFTNTLLPAVVMGGVTYLVYYLMTKRNWSLFKCVIVILILSLAASYLGIFNISSTLLTMFSM